MGNYHQKRVKVNYQYFVVMENGYFNLQPQCYVQNLYRGGDHVWPLPPPHTSFYHSHLALFLYRLTQFILSLTLYISLLSIAISPLTHLISYPPFLSSPLISFPLIYYPKYQFMPPFPPYSHKSRRSLSVWRRQYCQFPWKYFPCQSHPDPLSLISRVRYIPLLVVSLFTTLPYSFLHLPLYMNPKI